MQNKTDQLADLKRQNKLLGIFLVCSLMVIPITAVEFYKFGFMQGGIEVIKYAQKMTEIATKTV